VRLRRIAELEEARKALSAQDAYVWAQQAQADIAVVTHVLTVDLLSRRSNSSY
jgi:hypothetical protein